MLNFPFVVDEDINVEQELIQPVFSIKVVYGMTYKPLYIELFHENENSIIISIKMNHVRERYEIGNIFIERHIAGGCLETRSCIFHFDRLLIGACSKMVYVGDWGRAECGLKFESLDGEQFYIVSGDYPYSVALIGDRFEALGLVPEFALNEYHYEEIGPI
ncbi:hypothetical protein [Agrobacterium vitis]|uniref:Uncharacterized protein n=1 Tax=Agrobacterium vitis TaxID=373 RepID=A0AAE2RDF5_AGRVI|nr:hypothetical protein [Agrobacterium vitis]MBF2716423.1 hypothetical protein [Agrobacterium vitis]MUZ63361.1 hypothetical protein [Agrobacterium vitis]